MKANDAVRASLTSGRKPFEFGRRPLLQGATVLSLVNALGNAPAVIDAATRLLTHGKGIQGVEVITTQCANKVTREKLKEMLAARIGDTSKIGTSAFNTTLDKLVQYASSMLSEFTDAISTVAGSMRGTVPVTANDSELLAEALLGNVDDPVKVRQVEALYNGWNFQSSCNRAFDGALDGTVDEASTAYRSIVDVPVIEPIVETDKTTSNQARLQEELKKQDARLLKEEDKIRAQINQLEKWQRDGLTIERFPGDIASFDTDLCERLYRNKINKFRHELTQIKAQREELAKSKKFFEPKPEVVSNVPKSLDGFKCITLTTQRFVTTIVTTLRIFAKSIEVQLT